MQTNKKGSALVYVLVLLAFSAVFGVGAISIASHNTVMSNNEYTNEQAYLTSESGLQFMNDQFTANYTSSGLEEAIKPLLDGTKTSVHANNAEKGVAITLSVEETSPFKIRIDSEGTANGKTYKTTSYAIKNDKPFLEPLNVIGGKDKIELDDDDFDNTIIENNFDGTQDIYNKIPIEGEKDANDFKEEHALNSDVNTAGIQVLKEKFEGKYDDKCAIDSTVNRSPFNNHKSNKAYKIDNACVYNKEAYVFIKPHLHDHDYEIEIKNLYINLTDKPNVEVVYVYAYDKDHRIEEIEFNGTIKLIKNVRKSGDDIIYDDSNAGLIFLTFSELYEMDEGKKEIEGLEIEEEDGRKPNINGWVVAPNTKVEIENDKIKDGSSIITGGVISGGLEIETENDHGESALKIEGKYPSPSKYLDDIVDNIIKASASSKWDKNWSISYVE